MIRNESDTAWKEILDAYFYDFIAYCLPDLGLLIDWQKGWSSLDNELQAITKGTSAGKRLLDKLFKVYLKDGREQWILVHIEIQGQQDDDFPKRMFTYGYRIYDKYQQPVVSCAILSDDSKTWRPNYFKVGLAGSLLSTEFLVIKILDYHDKLAELEASFNPFAIAILVQLAAINAKRKPDHERKEIKFSLTRRLYEKGLGRAEIINLYRFIDWLIGLPEPLEVEYMNNLYELEGENKVAYISTIERFGIEKGKLEGIIEGKLEGIIEGKLEGIIEGKLEGNLEAKHQVAKHLLTEGIEISVIARATNLSLDQITALQEVPLLG